MQGVFFLQCEETPKGKSPAKKLLKILFPGANSKVVHHCAFDNLPENKDASLVEPKRGSFVLGHSSPERNDRYEMTIPAKASSVCTWYSGEFTNVLAVNEFTGFNGPEVASPGYAPTKLLLRLNSVKHEEDGKHAPSAKEQENYLNLVKTRVYDHLSGVFTFCTAYLSIGPHSQIILGNCYKDIFFFFVSMDNMKALVWSDRESTVFDALKENKYFVYAMTPMANNSVMVIHPQYTIGKWRKWKFHHKDNLERVVTLESYLQRKTLRVDR